jgi:hypothetical protein
MGYLKAIGIRAKLGANSTWISKHAHECATSVTDISQLMLNACPSRQGDEAPALMRRERGRSEVKYDLETMKL